MVNMVKNNYACYNEMKIDQNLLREFHDHNIPHIILRFRFKSTNIDLANIEHWTNIWKWYKHSPHWKHLD